MKIKKYLVISMLVLGSLVFADAKSDFQLAQKYDSEGKTQEALELLEKVSKSKDTEYKFMAKQAIGEYKYSINDIAGAEKEFLDIWKSAPDDSGFKLIASGSLITIYDLQQNYKAMEPILEWAVTKNSATQPLLLAMYNEIGNSAKANRKYREFKSKNTIEENITLNLEMAYYYMIKSNNAEAKKYLNEAYNLSEQGMLQSAAMLLQIAFDENDQKEAERIALDINSKTNYNNPYALDLLSNYYLQISDAENAQKTLEDLVAKFPDYIIGQFNLLVFYEFQNNTAGANKVYSQLRTLSKNNANLNYDVALYSYDLGAVDVAEKYLKKSIAEDKQDEALLILATLYYETNRISDARSTLQEAVRKNVNGAREMLDELNNLFK